MTKKVCGVVLCGSGNGDIGDDEGGPILVGIAPTKRGHSV